ncbi:MAG: MBL fold metallo-hydrolase [Thermoanaerobaculales bacterium]|jgi:ribonuclease Z|nr:MBL fold metallo-hydrolase [Thermoanaerobaculales bacterium]
MGLRRLVLTTSWGGLQLVGGSRAGEGTVLLLPQLDLAFDPGRAVRGLPPMRTVFASHGHLDHIGGLGYWASQRYLNSMPPAALLVPAAVEDDVRSLLGTLARLEGGRPYEIEVIPVDDGTRHRLRRDISLGFFSTDHWVPTLGATVTWHRRRLRPALAGLAETEIARRRLAGEEVTEEVAVDLLSYCADSGPRLLDDRPEIAASEILLVECSFFAAGDRERAARYSHTHLEDLLPHLPRMSCRHLVLLHASRRYRLREVEAYLDAEVRPRFPGELHHLNVDWE